MTDKQTPLKTSTSLRYAMPMGNKVGYNQHKLINHRGSENLLLGDFTPHDAEVSRHWFPISTVSYTVCTCTLPAANINISTHISYTMYTYDQIMS